MVEESIDGSDAADGRRLPPNSPWLRVVSGTCRAGAPVRCGRGACGSPIFGPIRNRVMLRLTVLFAFFAAHFCNPKVQKYMCNVPRYMLQCTRSEVIVSESTGAQG